VNTLVHVARPLPDVAGHVVEAVGAGRVEGLVAVVGPAVVEPDRGGVAGLARNLLEKVAAAVEVGVVQRQLIVPGEGPVVGYTSRRALLAL